MMATDIIGGSQERAGDDRGGSAARPWIAAVLSVLIPGLGQAFDRHYVRALAWFSPLAILLLLAVWAFSLSLADVVGAALDTNILWGVFWINIIGVLWRIGAAIDAYRLANGEVSGTAAFVAGWMVIALLVVTPHLFIGRYTLDAVTLVTAVFIDETSQSAVSVIPIGADADIVPDPLVADPDPAAEEVFNPDVAEVRVPPERSEAAVERMEGDGASFVPFSERIGTQRVSVLIAGGDAGPGRGGLRTDSMIVASLDLETGKAALFGFPRNMGSIPLPSRFQNAFVNFQKRLVPAPPPVEEGEEPVGAPAFRNCKCFPEQLNALYPYTRKWTKTYPDEIDPGMAALRDVLGNLMGIEIDYYVLVDMAAFVDLVDAIGGIDVNVRKPLEAEVSPPREGDPWAKVNVDVGWNHLDGPEALAYARARKGSSDYARMERQRCMLRGVAAKVDPVTILRSFPAIVNAVESSVVTDVPRLFVAELVGAASNLDFDDIQTVGFTHAYWEEKRDHLSHPIPVVGRIRNKVAKVLAGLDSDEAIVEGESECDV
jgi:LCP family protein required for cell wall assembly